MTFTDKELETEARRYLDEGSVPDIETGMRRACAIAAAAEVYVDALVRIATEKAIAEATSPQWLTAAQVAERTGFAVGTLANWRSAGTGPPWRKQGRVVRYPREELAEWMDGK